MTNKLPETEPGITVLMKVPNGGGTTGDSFPLCVDEKGNVKRLLTGRFQTNAGPIVPPPFGSFRYAFDTVWQFPIRLDTQRSTSSK